MEINAAIIQCIKKEAKSTEVELQTRDNVLEVNEQLQTLVNEVLKIYNNTQNTYGTFDSDIETYQFQNHLTSYHSGAHSIMELSISTMGLLRQQLQSSAAATGGYTLFVRYTNQEQDFLLIAMLKLKEGMSIDEENLELVENFSLDIQKLHEAARINLTRWRNREETYLSFVKKWKGKQDEVTKYFRLALGCTERTDSKVNTQNALKALDAFCEAQGWTRGTENFIEARRKTFEYFSEKRKNKEPVVVDSWSAYINDQDPEQFKQFVIENNFEINDTFTPNLNVYKKLNRISATIQKTIKVTFDVEDILQDKIDYDAETNSIIIHNIPETLRNDFLSYKCQDDDDTEE